MSTDTLRLQAPGLGQKRGLSWTRDLRTMRVFRFAFGVTLAMGIAFAGNWPLFFITPVLVSFLLALPLPALTLRQGAVNFLYVFVAFGIGLLFTLLLLPFPLVFVPALGLVLFHVYYLANRGGPPFLVVMILIAILILPILGLTLDVIATGFASAFAGSALLAIVLVWVAHGLFPDPSRGRLPTRPPRSRAYHAAAASMALKSTLVTLPLATAFFLFDWSSQLLVLVFSALFSLAPEVSKGKAAASKSMISTLIGGAAALLFYSLIVLVPEFHFFLALTLLVALLFAAVIFSDTPYAAYMSSAFIALVVLVGGSMGEDASITDKLITRVLLMSLAALYIVTALHFLNWAVARRGAR